MPPADKQVKNILTLSLKQFLQLIPNLILNFYCIFTYLELKGMTKQFFYTDADQCGQMLEWKVGHFSYNCPQKYKV